MLSIWFKTKPIERQRARESLRNRERERERERESRQLRQAVRQSRPNLKDRLQSLFLEIPIEKEENRPSVPLKKSLFPVTRQNDLFDFRFFQKKKQKEYARLRPPEPALVI